MEQTPTPSARISSETVLVLGLIASLFFTCVIWYAGDALKTVPHPPDQGALWYYWILTAPTWLTRAVAWSCYLLHQLTLGGLIWYAQHYVKEYTDGLHRINVIALGVNLFFAVAHFWQTHTFYDGLAQDVSNWSSQNSVVLLLVMVLIMENPRRGLLFGRPVPLKTEVVALVRRYHGYVFAWACTYTFWFHPMEATYGHLVGFFYLFMLLLQGSLFFTRVHRNSYWTIFLEVLVLLHATTVALYQGNNLWKMFGFGFATIFLVTQMHGLGFSRFTKICLTGLYVGCVVWAFSGEKLSKLEIILRIPLVEYLFVFILVGLLGFILWTRRTLRQW